MYPETLYGQKLHLTEQYKILSLFDDVITPNNSTVCNSHLNESADRGFSHVTQ